MNKLAKWWGVWIGFWLLIIGLAPALPGPRFLPPSWQAFMGLLTDNFDWVWPSLFVIAGVLCILGLYSTRVLIAGLLLCALVFFWWGCLSIYVWLADSGGSLPGSAAYFLVSGAKVILAYYIHKNDLIEEKVAQIGRRQRDLVTR